MAAFFIGAWLATLDRRPQVVYAFEAWADAEKAASALPDTDSAKGVLIVAAHERQIEWKRLDQGAFEAAVLLGMVGVFVGLAVGIGVQMV
ncbi:hypothetical protein ACH3VR_19665 [Microbacterium sp. B2969]|uniref:Uncharacterized protein n=1 Tax=Microbacterium alkaliflavum TaxID=3248839 RepID=A0ABW7QCH4_9MICO